MTPSNGAVSGIGFGASLRPYSAAEPSRRILAVGLEFAAAVSTSLGK